MNFRERSKICKGICQKDERLRRHLESDATLSHGNSTNTLGASPENVGLNESIGNMINDDKAKESNVEFTEGMKTISVRRDLEQVNVRPKVILYVGDSMFHGLDEARMKVQNIRAIKQVKSGTQ